MKINKSNYQPKKFNLSTFSFLNFLTSILITILVHNSQKQSDSTKKAKKKRKKERVKKCRNK